MDTLRITATSHAHNFTSRRETASHSRNYAFLAFLGGLVLFVAGLLANSAVLATIGFLPLVVGFLTLNAYFWAGRLDSVQENIRISQSRHWY